MPRRGHKKSRAGCADCKRRHVKCDETRPSCVNCKVASLRCSYTKSTESLSSAPRSTIGTPSYSPLTPETNTSIIPRQDVPLDSMLAANSLNLDHLELLHHWLVTTYTFFSTDRELAATFREHTVTHGLRFPFLMYAVLAISALNLCRLRPEKSKHYRNLASTLQSLGLTGLNDALLNINEENCIAMFLFCAITGMHSFCDTFTFRDDNFNAFLDKLTGCINLMRGIRSVLGGGWWEYLRTSSLAGLFATGELLGGPDIDKNKETKPLWDLLEEADLGTASMKTYTETVTTLQRVFNGENRLANPETSLSMVFAWPVMLNSDYNELLIQRRPEALVILSFYGVVLHRHHGAWAVGDSGQFLINAICNYLGKHWERWLQWPKAIIATTPIATASNTPMDS